MFTLRFSYPRSVSPNSTISNFFFSKSFHTFSAFFGVTKIHSTSSKLTLSTFGKLSGILSKGALNTSIFLTGVPQADKLRLNMIRIGQIRTLFIDLAWFNRIFFLLR